MPYSVRVPDVKIQTPSGGSSKPLFDGSAIFGTIFKIFASTIGMMIRSVSQSMPMMTKIFSQSFSQMNKGRKRGF